MLEPDEILSGLRRIETQAPEDLDLRCLGCKVGDNCSLKGCRIIKEAISLIEDLLQMTSDDTAKICELDDTISSIRELIARFKKKG